jgi:hypothetical protein
MYKSLKSLKSAEKILAKNLDDIPAYLEQFGKIVGKLGQLTCHCRESGKPTP